LRIGAHIVAQQGAQSQRVANESACVPADWPLEWLIHPISKEVFFQEYWEKKPLVVNRKQPNYFKSLLTLDQVDCALTTLDLRHPNITLKNAEKRVTADDYTIDGEALDVAKVYQLFQEGSTITLAYLDNVIPSVASFCRGLEKEFSYPFQANVYLTPGRAKGAKHHYDTHDVFVLQAAHSKQWTLYGTPVELPLSGQDFDSGVHEQGAPTMDFQLNSGDMAYIPRGLVHDARSTEDASLHITVGVLTYTWIDLLLELAADASLHDVAFRKALPPGFAQEGFDRTNARAIVRDLIQRLATTPNFDVMLDRFVDEFVMACPPLLRGQMAQMTTVNQLTLDSVVGARAGVVSHIRTDGESTSVHCYGRKITFPSYTEDALRASLNSPQFVVRSLPEGLDDQGKVALTQRLIKEGLVEILKL
jgi:ribosomal protein L16 Arg81 hydroxylase